MPTIHPTAILDDRVILADDVFIGPGCVIEGDVSIGPGTRLLHRVTLHGPLTLGANNVLYPNVCLGFAPQDMKYDHDRPGPGVVIGDGNVIREGVTIHRATKELPTTVGSRNYFMVNSHLGHDVAVGNDCTLANGVLIAGHVEIQDQAVLGGNAAVHQFCRVGRMSMISGVVAVTKDAPPFCTCYDARRVGSLNLVGLRRAGFRDHIKPLTHAFKLLYRERLMIPAALERIEREVGDDPLVAELCRFVRGSKRGIMRYGGHGATDLAEA